MAQKNHIEIRGIIGNARIYNTDGPQVARFSVATDYIYMNKDGGVVRETTWHSVTAFKNDKMSDFSKLAKGAGVEVTGRLRNLHYVDNMGVDRTSPDILAEQITVLS